MLRRIPALPSDTLLISPLGGVGEVGKNSTLYQYDNHLLLVDAGVKFPEEALHGVDLVIPDFGYVTERPDDLIAILITHGHEDHIGAIPHLLMQLERQEPVPIYGAPLALGFIGVKLKEHGLREAADLRPIGPGERLPLGPFEAEAISVNHSVPDSLAFAIRTPVGLIVHTGDFKFDPTPVDGATTDADTFRRLGDEGVLALLSDCVRIEQPGWTPSERIVSEALGEILAKAPGRVIVTTFASNIGRLREVMRAGYQLGRRAAVVGRSMDENLKVARELGFLDLPTDVMIDLRSAQSLPPNQVVLLATGSQGEPTSVLSRMGAGDYRPLKILPQDTVVFSATAVPGNEETVAQSIDNLFRRGARVIYRALNERVHVSGHASREELKHMIELTRPRYCIPLHGEYRMLVLYRELAAEAGVPPESVFVMEIGDVLAFGPEGAERAGAIPSGSVLVDGLTIGGVTRVVLRDRRRLAADGIIVVSVAVDRETGELLSAPDVVARGFASPHDGEILEEARDRVERALRRVGQGEPEYGFLMDKIKDTLRLFIYEQTRQRPMILPVVTEV
ncbi:MAG: ribonuclease J [Chloroflexi bacterium]|nr:ribonuclease J [Chloroflexota bacterium]